jgi:hypothetical protein
MISAQWSKVYANFFGLASHCDRNRDNQALSGDSDLTTARKAVQTCATTTEVRAAGEASLYPSDQLAGVT